MDTNVWPPMPFGSALVWSSFIRPGHLGLLQAVSTNLSFVASFQQKLSSNCAARVLLLAEATLSFRTQRDSDNGR